MSYVEREQAQYEVLNIKYNMKPKPIRLFSRAAMLLMMTLTATTAWAWSGEGTEVNPYKITSANDLIQLATDVNGDWHQHSSLQGPLRRRQQRHQRPDR